MSDVDLSFIGDAEQRKAIEKALKDAIDSATNGLKNKNAELLDEKKKLSEQHKTILEQLKDIDLGAAREALKTQEEMKRKEMIDKGKYEEMLQIEVTTKTERMKSDYEAKLSEYANKAKILEDQYNSYQNKYKNKLLEDQLRALAFESGCYKEASVVEDFIRRGKEVFKLNENETGIEARDANGDLIKTPEGDILVPQKFATMLKKTCPHYFPPSAGSASFGGSSKASMGGDIHNRLAAAAESGNMEEYKKLKSQLFKR